MNDQMSSWFNIKNHDMKEHNDHLAYTPWLTEIEGLEVNISYTAL